MAVPRTRFLVAVGPFGNPVVPALGEVVGDLRVVDGVEEVLMEDAEDEGDVEALFVEVLDAELGVALALAVVPLVFAVWGEVGQLTVGAGAGSRSWGRPWSARGPRCCRTGGWSYRRCPERERSGPSNCCR